MDKSKYGVHQTHCCILHGCKYGNEDCPVILKQVDQEYLCEDCEWDRIENIEQAKEQALHYEEQEREWQLQYEEGETESIEINVVLTNEGYKKNELHFEEEDSINTSDYELQGKELLFEQIEYGVHRMLYNTLDHPDHGAVEENKSIIKDIREMLNKLRNEEY